MNMLVSPFLIALTLNGQETTKGGQTPQSARFWESCCFTLETEMYSSTNERYQNWWAERYQDTDMKMWHAK
jgi:hypothetical protein